MYLVTKKENKVEKLHIKVFRLPRNGDEQHLWIKNTPFKNLKFIQNFVICIKHWHGNFATVRRKGNKERPAEPNSEWPDVLLTCLRTLQPPPRPTQRTSLTVGLLTKMILINEFMRRDRVSFQDVIQRVVEILILLPNCIIFF